MTKHVFLFLGTFAVGALIALVARAAMFAPHAPHESAPSAALEYAPMVTNPLAPVERSGKPATPASPTPQTNRPEASVSDPHAGHPSAAVMPAADKPVNTVCAICGMAVDPKLPTLEYKGQTIGFGCKMCAPKFKADPDRYGPAYLRNQVIEK
jgi:YHS domain-containing protein